MASDRPGLTALGFEDIHRECSVEGSKDDRVSGGGARYTAAGPDSPKKDKYPAYFDRVGENPRGIHAVRLMQQAKGLTPETLTRTIFDSQQPELEVQVPLLVKAWDAAPASNPLKATLKEPVDALRTWDHRWAADSVPQTLGYFWAEELWSKTAEQARAAKVTVYDYIRM